MTSSQPFKFESSIIQLIFWGNVMKEKVKQGLEKIRPSLQADGGDVEFVDYEDGVVKVKLTGACSGCPFAQITLSNGIEKILKETIPEVKKVLAV